jgi:threonine/homoserine/homoserine lactone efflux protein
VILISRPDFQVFLLATLVLLLTPGPAVLYIVTRSVDQGRPAGLASVAGIETGNFIQVLAVTLGLSAVLASSATVFSVVKGLGAAYLVYLGVRRMLARETVPGRKDTARQPLRDVYRHGVAVAVLNPKTALFFLAFLPQFVDPAGGSIPLQLFTLGCVFVSMAFCTDGLYSLLAVSASRWLKRTPVFVRAERFVIGGVYVGLGLAAALAGLQRK